MRKLVIASLTIIVLTACTQIPKPRRSSPRKAPEQQLKTQINHLLTQLAAEEFQTREAAQTEFEGLLRSGHGGVVLERLREVHKTAEDPEVRQRLECILKLYNRWQITPAVLDAIPNIAELLEERSCDGMHSAIETLRNLGTRDSVRMLRSITEFLIVLLRNDDADTRCSATGILGEMSDKRAVEPLINVLEDDEVWYIRAYAARALGKIGDERAVEPLYEVFMKFGEINGIRAEAALALGKIGGPATNKLIGALKDTNWQVGCWAATALGFISDERVVNSLIAALKDKNLSAYVHASAAEALGTIGDTAAVDPLLHILNDASRLSILRSAAAEGLGKIGDRRVVTALMGVLSNGNTEPDVCASAAKALGEIGDDRALELLIETFGDKEWYVRSAAAEALGKIGASAVEPLLELWERRKDKYGRVCIAHGLAKITGDESAFKYLVIALQDGDPEVRYCAAYALGDIGGEGVIAPLIESLKDEDAGVQDIAVEALQQITGKNLDRWYEGWKKWYEGTKDK